MKFSSSSSISLVKNLLFLSVFIVFVWACSSDDNKVDNGDSDISVDGDGTTESDSIEQEEESSAPICGELKYTGQYMIPGPSEEGFDKELDAKAKRIDRSFHAFNAYSTGANCDVTVKKEDEMRSLITKYVQEHDGWDFNKFAGDKTVEDVIEGWQKVAGLYGGMGICADAFMYGVFRDQGYSCEDIEAAKKILLKSIDAMEVAFTIAGKPGVVVRGFIRTDMPGDTVETTPLFDKDNKPLPEIKDNGTWRNDQSGKYANYAFEDSCSRDMLLGWAGATACVMEVIRDDPAFTDEIKNKIKGWAKEGGKALMQVAESGYDLEIPDADGRTTYHGYLNEANFERMYADGYENGFYSTMALGIVASYAYASDDPDLKKYLIDELVKKRKLPEITLKDMGLVNGLELQANFSNYNMVVSTMWMALRYIGDDAAYKTLKETMDKQIYNHGKEMNPIDMKQSLFDFVYAFSTSNASATKEATADPDKTAIQNGLETLKGFPDAPIFEYAVENCDEAEIASGVCELNDGTTAKVLGTVGRKGDLICDRIIPMKIRPTSNYYWRSSPYKPNGGGSDGHRMVGGTSFRIAYWLGRWTKLK